MGGIRSADIELVGALVCGEFDACCGSDLDLGTSGGSRASVSVEETDVSPAENTVLLVGSGGKGASGIRFVSRAFSISTGCSSLIVGDVSDWGKGVFVIGDATSSFAGVEPKFAKLKLPVPRPCVAVFPNPKLVVVEGWLIETDVAGLPDPKILLLPVMPVARNGDLAGAGVGAGVVDVG